MHPIDVLRSAVQEAAAELGDGSARPTLERPKKAGFGDYSTNAAMLLAPRLGEPPRQIAERLRDALRERLGDRVEKVEIAGPGFVNVYLADPWYTAAAAHLLAAGDEWGGGTAAERERIVIEFVSANPTGPLTAAHGRHAAYGDALARLLEFAGHHVSREYYFNDAGGQLIRLGQSIRARARGEPVAEDGYPGEYVAELAAEIDGAAETDPEDLAFAGGQLMIERIKETLERFGVTFDTWFSERSLHDGAIERALERVEQAGHSYRSEGALWLRTSSFGDSQDRVMLKSDGVPTYFAADVAYVENKVERGFQRQITPLGADHHGYVPRFKAALAVLGEDPDRLEIPLLQFMHVVERGERASMSKRRGEFITLDDLVDRIGADATRYFLLQRSHDSTIDLDLELAIKEEPENPVYYVQYAHARTANILRRVGDERVEQALSWSGRVDLHASERELVLKLLAFPDEAAEAAERRAPHRIAIYALELARSLAAFYRDCQVLHAETEDLKSFRVRLTIATKRTLARSLGLLGVSAPERM